MPQVMWRQCFCGLPQYFAHMSDSARATASRRCKWILTHNLTLTIPAFSHHHSDWLSCKIHGSVCSTLIYKWRCIFHVDLCMEVYILDGLLLLIHISMSCRFESESSVRSTILSWVHATCCPSCDWLQQSHTPHKIELVLSFAHTLPVAPPQPSNALRRGFELA